MQNDPRLLDEFRARLTADARGLARAEGGDGAAVTVRGWFGGETRAASFDDQNFTSAGMSSTKTLDRYFTILEPEGWQLDNYRKNPVVLVNHMDFGDKGLPIGVSLEERIVPDGLYSRSKFFVEETRAAGSTRIAEIWAIHRAGGMPALSVSFVPETWEEFKHETPDGKAIRGIRFTRQEKLEHSLVTIPGAADALTYGLSRVAIASAKRLGRELPHTELPGALGLQSQAGQLLVSCPDLFESMSEPESPWGDPVISARVRELRRKFRRNRLATQPKAAGSYDFATAIERLRALGADIRATS